MSLLIAILVAGAAAGAAPAGDWVDMSTGKSKIYLNTRSVSAHGDGRAAKVVIVDGDKVTRTQIDFDCKEQRYRFHLDDGSHSAWGTDDPANVKRVCTLDFAGLAGLSPDQMNRIIWSAAGIPPGCRPAVVIFGIGKDQFLCSVEVRLTGGAAVESSLSADNSTKAVQWIFDRATFATAVEPGSAWPKAGLGSADRTARLELRFAHDKKTRRQGLSEISERVRRAVPDLRLTVPQAASPAPGAPPPAAVIKAGSWSKALKPTSPDDGRYSFQLYLPTDGEPAKYEDQLWPADVSGLETALRDQLPLKFELRDSDGRAIYTATFRLPPPAKLREALDRAATAVVAKLDSKD